MQVLRADVSVPPLCLPDTISETFKPRFVGAFACLDCITMGACVVRQLYYCPMKLTRHMRPIHRKDRLAPLSRVAGNPLHE